MTMKKMNDNDNGADDNYSDEGDIEKNPKNMMMLTMMIMNNKGGRS